MVSKLKLFNETVERDLELESLWNYSLKVFNSIIGVCQVQKRNRERKECEEKEKKS
jgi:hypothetical protein